MAEILLTGGTGLVGGRLQERLLAGGHRLRVLSRKPRPRSEPDGTVRVLQWDGLRVSSEHLAGCDAVVHLAGEPIFGGFPTAVRKKRMVESRVDSTQALVQSLATLSDEERPETFVCASAVGIYPSAGDRELVESEPPANGFLADLCRRWESAAESAESLGVRRVSLRIGIVLAADGGALSLMRLPFSLGLGGRLGDGRQWMPWVHLDDVVELLRVSVDDPRYRGAINACSPNPVRNAEFTQILAQTLRRPAFLPVPGFVLRSALGELSGELLGSRRVLPERALSLGFDFRHEELAPALADLLGRP